MNNNSTSESETPITDTQGTSDSPSDFTPTTAVFAIQVGGSPSGAITPQMSAQDFIEGSQEQFQKIAAVVEVAGQSFVQRINQLANKPASCSVEFGVNVGGETGVPFVTKGTVGANFKVTITWEAKAKG
jgi:hypothetical protein